MNAALAFIVVLAAPAATAPAAELRAAGTVTVAGAGGRPVVWLAAADGRRWVLVGEPAEELARVQGHRVEVRARPAGKRLLADALEVEGYDILDAGDGRRPAVGRLVEEKGRLALEAVDRRMLVLEASEPMLALLRRSVGGKVWVAGEVNGIVLRVAKFGVLRPPRPRH